MPEFHNPYHFVPATRQGPARRRHPAGPDPRLRGCHPGQIVQPGASRCLGPGAHSGRILCRLTLERPTLVGSLQTEPTDGHGPKTVEPYTCHCRDREGKDQVWPGLPGSSLRGMVGAVAEAISQSSLRVLEDRAYSGHRFRKSAPGADASATGREDHDHAPHRLP